MNGGQVQNNDTSYWGYVAVVAGAAGGIMAWKKWGKNLVKRGVVQGEEAVVRGSAARKALSDDIRAVRNELKTQKVQLENMKMS